MHCKLFDITYNRFVGFHLTRICHFYCKITLIKTFTVHVASKFVLRGMRKMCHHLPKSSHVSPTYGILASCRGEQQLTCLLTHSKSGSYLTTLFNRFWPNLAERYALSLPLELHGAHLSHRISLRPQQTPQPLRFSFNVHQIIFPIFPFFL